MKNHLTNIRSLVDCGEITDAVESAVQTSSPFIKLAILRYNAYYTIGIENSYKGKEFLKESAGISLRRAVI